MLYSGNNQCYCSVQWQGLRSLQGCAMCSGRVSGDSRGVQRAVAGSQVTPGMCSVQWQGLR